jgi:polar amino acid transport system substrate-binding protein
MRKATSKLLVIPAIALALTLAGCGTSPEASGKAGGGATTSHLDKILESGKIKIAVKADTVPWGQQQANGEYEGYDIDLAHALGEALGAEVELVTTTNETRIPLLQTDKVDVVIANFSATAERAQSIEFTEPYFMASISLDVPVDSPIKTYADLDGKKVSVSRGSTQEVALRKQFPNVEAVLFGSYADALQAIKSKKVDAVIQNTDIMEKLAQDDPNFRVLEGPKLNPVGLSMGVQRGDQAWLNFLNTFIENWNDGGDNQAATQKWVGMDMDETLK